MSKKLKLLVTGGSGYLGRHLTQAAASTFTVYATYATTPAKITAGIPHHLELTSRSHVTKLITQLEPDAIIHCAAANPGAAEQTMMQINAQGSRYVAEAAITVGARLVHLSSDSVHAGRSTPYGDDEEPSPVNYYGETKAAAEAAIAEVDPRAAIVRTSLIYGLREMDRGTQGFAKRLEANEPLFLFHDVIRQPIWVDSLVEALLKLAFQETAFAGTLNIAGRQALSREAFGRAMLAWWQVANQHLVQAGSAAGLPQPPPLEVQLAIGKAEMLLNMAFLGVETVLDE